MPDSSRDPQSPLRDPESFGSSRRDPLPPGWNRPLPEKIARPTYWPAALAFGATLTLWGPVTTLVISAVGLAVSAVALIGWIYEVRNAG